MMTPTERVTMNARTYLGSSHDVVLAVRVEWGLGTEKPTFWSALGLWLTPRIPLVLPLLNLTRARATKERMASDINSGCGILALTAQEDRILLSAMPARRKIPTGVVEVLPRAAPLLCDIAWMETYLVPRLTVGERELVADGVDFKALLKAVEAGTIESPELASQMSRLTSIGFGPFV